MITFKDFPLSSELITALEKQGIVNPTEIQEKAVPALLGKKIDFHGQAQTGTGKTLAFGIPLIENIDSTKKAVQALVVAPTRELVVQIVTSLQPLARAKKIAIEAIYGGVSIERQISALKKGVHVVVGTPGRLIDLLNRKKLSLQNLTTLVLDEADIMLDMGFKEDIDEILKYAPKNRQIWLFSATVKEGISLIKCQHMKDPLTARVSAKQVATQNIKQYFAVIPIRDRFYALCRFIDNAPEFYGIIFCRTKILTAEVAEHLSRLGYKASALHGDMSQLARNRVIKRFKEKKFTILLATDVAARGIDISDLTHVVNYSFPEDPESYVHRIGRTGRAGKEGIAITFISRGDVRRMLWLAKRFKAEIKPIDVPNLDEIAKVRIKEAHALFAKLIKRSLEEDRHNEKLYEIVGNYDKEQLIHAAVALLHEQFFKHLTKDKRRTFEKTTQLDLDKVSKERGFAGRGGRTFGDKEELVIFLGSDDGINKKDVISFITKNSNVSQKDIIKLRVIKRRSFVTFSGNQASLLAQKLKGKTMKGHRVRTALESGRSFRPRPRRRNR